MVTDPFKDARRLIDQALGAFESHVDRARSSLDQTLRLFEERIPDARKIVEDHLKKARRDRRPPGPRKPPSGGLARRFGPSGPGPSPMPAPVKPNSPSLLGGAAEAPLDP